MNEFEELGEAFVPDNILFREKEMELLNKVVDNFITRGINAGSLNVIVFGGTGTGKTALIKKIIKERGEEKFLYRSIGTGWTLNQILKSLIDKEYSTTATLLHKVKEYLKENPKILIFDELNKLKDKKQLNLFMESLNEIWRDMDGTIPIIILTNIFNIKENQRMDGKTALSLRPIRLKVYSKEELTDIFMDRVKNFNEKYNFQISIKDIFNISLIVSLEGDGSARQVRRILHQCCIENNFKTDFIENLISGVMEEDISEMISRINEREKNFLYLLYKIFVKKKNIGGYMYITYDNIRSLCNLSIRTIQNYLDIIESYGFIETKFENKGRGYGRRRLIIFNEEYFVNNKKFIDGIDESPCFDDLPEIRNLNNIIR